MANFELTTPGHCPYCDKTTPTLRLEKGNRTIYKCIVCLKEPTGTIEPLTFKELIEIFEKFILSLKENEKAASQDSP